MEKPKDDGIGQVGGPQSQDPDPTFRHYKIRQIQEKLRAGVPMVEIDGMLDQLKFLYQMPQPPAGGSQNER